MFIVFLVFTDVGYTCYYLLNVLFATVAYSNRLAYAVADLHRSKRSSAWDPRTQRAP